MLLYNIHIVKLFLFKRKRWLSLSQQTHLKQLQLFGKFVVGFLVRFGGLLLEPKKNLDGKIVRELVVGEDRIVVVSDEQDYISYPVEVHNKEGIRLLQTQHALSLFFEEVTETYYRSTHGQSENSVV